MIEFAKTVISREEIDFSFEERQGYFVYHPLRKSLSDHIPDGCVLHLLNGQPVSNIGLHLSDIYDYMSWPDHYPLSLVVGSEQGLQDLKDKKRLTKPVPYDFFGEIPTLTQEDIKHYTSLAHSWVKGLLDATTDEGFEYVCTKSNVDIYQGIKPGSQVHLIRGSTRVKASKEESIALMIAPTTESFRHLFKMIDVNFKDGLVLHKFPTICKADGDHLPFYSIKWAIMGTPVPSPIWDRDVCWLEYADIIHDNEGKEIGFGVGSSITRPECPNLEHHKLVRAEIACTGYVFKKCDGDPGYMDVTYIIQADPKGLIPKWAVNKFAWQQALNVVRIKMLIEGTLKAKEKMDHQERNNAEVVGFVVPKRQIHKVQIQVTVPNSMILFGFCSEHHDIGFFISGLLTEQDWSKTKRFDSHVYPVNGQVC